MASKRPPRSSFLPFFLPPVGEEEIEEVVDTLRSNWITTGPKTRRFEEAFATRVNADGALATNSWTAAAHTALMALGIGPGDEVITSVMTFCATVNIIEHVGATPVLVDVEPDTLNLDPAAVEAAMTPRTKLIIPVHYAGHPVELDRIEIIAGQHGVKILEDAAHALPASYKGRVIGSGPNLVAFSFYATKNLTTAEGGMLTGDREFLSNARIYTLHGMSNNAWNRYDKKGAARYEVTVPGFKYNLTDIQSAMGLRQLEKLADFQKRRRSIAARYNEAFSEMEALETPVSKPEVEHAWHLYVLRLREQVLPRLRDRFCEELKARNIGTSLHFIPIHLHAYYREKYGHRPEDFPVAYDAYQRMLSLPIHPRLSDGDMEDVIQAVLETTKKLSGPPASAPGLSPDREADPAQSDASPGEEPPPPMEGAPSSRNNSDAESFRIYLSPPLMTGKEVGAVADAIRSHWVAPQGPHLRAFESAVAGRLGVGHACALSSGTAAIHLGLRALGVGPGDDVLCSTFTFIAAANPIHYLGANCVFVDSEADTWNMDPALVADYLKEAAGKGRLPKAVVVADIYGQCADFDGLREACSKYEIPILEDAAEALGASARGRPAGSFGDIAALSFNGNKVITTSGGGMVVSRNREWIDKARFWATQAREPGLQYEHREIGQNYRLSNVLAALGLVQLEALEDFVDRKRRIFERYRRAFADDPGITWMPEPAGWSSTRWLSCLRIDPEAHSRNAMDLCQGLLAAGIESRPLWKPLHTQPVFQGAKVLGGAFSEKLAAEGVSLPSGCGLTEAEQDEVIDRVKGLLG